MSITAMSGDMFARVKYSSPCLYDEVILCENNFLFLSHELSNPYKSGNTHVDPMTSHDDHYGIVDVDSCASFWELI